MTYDIDNILESTDLLELVGQAGGQLHKLSGEYRCACPLHHGDGVNNFAVFQKEGRWLWKCFSGSCGGGDAISFVQTWRGVDFKRACEWLTGETVDIDPIVQAERARERAEETARALEAQIERAQVALQELRSAERHLYYHEHMTQLHREKWLERGIDEGWQEFWFLGGAVDYAVGEYHTPTLTIPLFDERMQVVNIKHRLITPPDGAGKYRYETKGLEKPPFLSIPTMGYDGGVIIVTEGEIKAAVFAATVDDPDWQCIGVPGRNGFKPLVEQLMGKPVVVIPDPGAEAEALELAKATDGRFIQVPEKIDDFILETGIKQSDLFRMIKQARKA